MEVVFYKCTDDKRKLNKNITQSYSVTCNIKNDVDLVNMIIVVSKFNNWQYCNYCYLPSFNRYYFVKNVTLKKGELLELSLHCDVLMSYKDDIKKLNCHILRQENIYNNYIVDDKLMVRSDRNIVKKNVGSFGTDSCIIMNISGGVF